MKRNKETKIWTSTIREKKRLDHVKKRIEEIKAKYNLKD